MLEHTPTIRLSVFTGHFSSDAINFSEVVVQPKTPPCFLIILIAAS